MNEAELHRLRQAIDDVDEALALLLEKRQALARSVGEAKGESPVFDPARERTVIERLKGRHPSLDGKGLEAIQREVISLCRAVQQRPRVALMGPEGSFSQQAAHAGLGHSIDPVFTAGPWEAFAALERGEATLAVVPIENTIEGVVYATLDAFAKAPTDLAIVGEVRLPIRHVLATGGCSLEEIVEVRSHPQALAQCRLWLTAHLAGTPQKPSSTTSGAAQEASAERGIAAICSEAAALSRGLTILRRSIQDQPNNRTRFWIVGRDPSRPGQGAKTSLLFYVAHRPGSLLGALEPLREAQRNLTFIQSRPLPENPFEYVFFLDVEGDAGEEPLASALKAMGEQCFRLRVLGSYPCGDSAI
ncbi:prephenate dehydratase [Aminithiophilus ramosus]|uniref:Bifunctional chorismate mutase/prephenate dehydratase n=2 Tax=Synergistales TaxID=649776 RepID=A0A9Q7AAY2_9BACT|nr:prephenate dehydratase [Aminithiophilus ramosus]QTX31803.1 prephenate dehydratase [Aminithiophilus ramosus]QVL35626.1 prephenate dehydratase [Synergistota bacterium]